MKEIWKNLKNWQKIAGVCGILVIIVVVALAVVFASKNGPKVKINFENKNNIPSSEMTKIREKMVGVIRSNTKDFNDNNIYVGNARDYSESVSGDSTTATFVVDFDEIKESYSVMVTWPDSESDAPNVIISCPILDTKYPETVCNTESNSSEDIISFLPYEGVDDSGVSFKITSGYSFSNLYLEIKGDGDAMEAVAAAKKWLLKWGFNLEDYLVYVLSNKYIQISHAKTNDENVNENLPYFMPGVYYVIPTVDTENNVTGVSAKMGGCTDFQTDPVEENITGYLKSKGISYPVNFEYCAE